MNVKELHIKVQVTRKQNAILQKVLHAKGVAWDTGDPCDGRANVDAFYLRLFNGKLYRIWSESPWHFIQETKGELLHWHTMIERIDETEPLESQKDLEKMSAAANEYALIGWRFEYWAHGKYIVMNKPDHTPSMMRIYETGEVEKADPFSGRFKRVR